METVIKNLPVFVSLLLYGLSLASPAFRFIKTYPNAPGTPDVWDGLNVLLVGWLGIFLLQFGWAANPWYWLSLFCVWTHRWRSAVITSGIALAIAAVSVPQLFRQILPADEGFVGKLTFERLEIGFYFWAIALTVPFVWSAVQLGRSR